MRIIVSDTGPLLHLEESGNLELLTYLGDIYLPPMVALEWERISPGWQDRWPHLATVVALEDKFRQIVRQLQVQAHIDPGEAEALALVDQLKADMILTDDAEAREVAKDLGIVVHGSFGVILEAARSGKLTYGEAEAAVARVAQSSLRKRLNRKVVNRARAALYKIFNVPGK